MDISLKESICLREILGPQPGISHLQRFYLGKLASENFLVASLNISLFWSRHLIDYSGRLKE